MVMTRLEIITEAKSRVGEKAQSLNSINIYDVVTQFMSTQYPLIPHQKATGLCTNGVPYITPPSVNIREIEKVKLGSPLTEIRYIDPELFNTFKGASNAFPSMWTYQKLQEDLSILLDEDGTPITVEDEGLYNEDEILLEETLDLSSNKHVSLYPAPDSNYPYAMYYGVINEKSSGDDYAHSMTEYMDESVILGVAWKLAELAGEYQKAVNYKDIFLKDLTERATTVTLQFVEEG